MPPGPLRSAPRPAAELVLTAPAADSVRHGHPWVWNKGVVRGGTGLPPGAEVVLRGPQGEPVGRGIFEPSSPIAVRVWSLDAAQPVDEAHVRDKLRRALALRSALFHGDATNAYRVVHGEGDRMPGLVIDRYDRVAIVRLDGAGADAVGTRFQAAVASELAAAGVTSTVLRRSQKGEAPTFEVWGGTAAPKSVVVKEHGVPFVVDLDRGQKTGAFLDQRENRRRVGASARGKTVLNLFSYAGGFSLHAAVGGASHVTSVDVAAAAHGTAQASFRAAGIDPRPHAFVSADVFAFLARAAERKEAWDIVVSDPPSFAPSEKSRGRALSAYRTLHQAAVQVLAPGGVLFAASCSSHVTADDFLGTLDDAALTPRRLSLLELHGPPPDHPTLAAWPEGRYLKLAVLS